MHNHAFDAKHTFKVNKFSDIERYSNLDETYVEPETEEYAPRVCRLNKLVVNVLNYLGTSTCMAGRSTRTRPIRYISRGG